MRIRSSLAPISIHALREERDTLSLETNAGRDISIHALREERDASIDTWVKEYSEFQSTRSARSATKSTPRVVQGREISIHALREERDRQRFQL